MNHSSEPKAIAVHKAPATERSHRTEFWRATALAGLVALIIAGTFIALSLRGSWPDEVKLDGQTLANYVAMVLATAVAAAGAWVAIGIADTALQAQRTANLLQERETQLCSPEYALCRQRTALREQLLVLVSMADLVEKSVNDTLKDYIYRAMMLIGEGKTKSDAYSTAFANVHNIGGLAAHGEYLWRFAQGRLEGSLQDVTPVVLRHLRHQYPDEEEAKAHCSEWMASCAELVKSSCYVKSALDDFARPPASGAPKRPAPDSIQLFLEGMEGLRKFPARLEEVLAAPKLGDEAYVRERLEQEGRSAAA